MQRQSLLVAVVAAIALLSFSVGAASIDAATGSDRAEMSRDDSEIDNPDGQGLSDPPGSIDPPESDGGARALLPSVPAPAVGALAVGLAVGLVVLWRLAGQSRTIDEAGGETPAVTTPESARSPAHSAAEIEVPLTNDVYRAWAALEDAVTPENSSSTPQDIEADATAAGADPEAVASLRSVFERVRYGRERPDADLETQAREALERAADDADAIATSPDDVAAETEADSGEAEP
ncbi:DUF4129 domain-containing protein [Haloarcula sp. CBA1130]|uniref:DUF4129 domain-containing protein n=1 Tax=unclassified Haloarcula TaxID=2624677 RepID=UPI001249428A|nr:MULTISPECIES: DUF4129 domain-containing protein [unclassified Haloarcula]KAA9399489.1 DUF4129 domain-containing protein [Haloarcula sp. CBA1129]KAA9401212.1 DUF4129 domain-containing protein [Haloarcula sp. CBA1130]